MQILNIEKLVLDKSDRGAIAFAFAQTAHIIRERYGARASEFFMLNKHFSETESEQWHTLYQHVKGLIRLIDPTGRDYEIDPNSADDNDAKAQTELGSGLSPTSTSEALSLEAQQAVAEFHKGDRR